MSEPIISIITPTYKRVSTGELDACILSVDGQVDDRWKHYIIGDCCPELEKYRKKLEKTDAVQDGRRVIVNLENNSNDLGVTPLNYGLSLAKELYFCILADDNLWLPHHLAALLEFMVRNEGLYDFAFGNQIILHKRIPEFYRIKAINEPGWNKTDLGDPIYRRELWERHGPFAYRDRPDIGDTRREGNKYSYDWHFLHDCIAAGAKWVHMNFDPSIKWYMDDHSPVKSTNWHHDALRIGGLPAGEGACAWYRMRAPLSVLTDTGKAYVSYAPQTPSEYAVEQWFQNQEVLVFQGVGNYETVPLMERLKDVGKVCVCEVDDHIAAIDYDNTSYHKMGTKDVSFQFKGKDECLKYLNMWLGMAMNEGTDTTFIKGQIDRVEKSEDKTFEMCLHKNGHNGFDIERNLRIIDAARTCYRTADGVQTTTEHFAKVLREYNDNVFVFPNCLDFNVWDSSLRFERPDNTIRIVWSGGSSHLEDLMICRDALADVLKRHTECVFVVAGFLPDGFARVFDTKQIEVHPWWDFKEHPYRLHRLRADIGIIPLRDSEFANCKSNIKWVELSGLGVPCVASDSVVYNKDISDGETGFLFSNPAEFTRKMEILINDRNKRLDMGTKANGYVKANYDIGKWTQKLLRWYETMWLKKNITQPERNTLTPKLKAKLEKELGRPINSVKALDGAV